MQRLDVWISLAQLLTIMLASAEDPLMNAMRKSLKIKRFH